jgi:hypothetical protein
MGKQDVGKHLQWLEIQQILISGESYQIRSCTSLDVSDPLIFRSDSWCAVATVKSTMKKFVIC